VNGEVTKKKKKTEMQATKSTIKLRPYILRDRSLRERDLVQVDKFFYKRTCCIKEITYENEKRENFLK